MWNSTKILQIVLIYLWNTMKITKDFKLNELLLIRKSIDEISCSLSNRRQKERKKYIAKITSMSIYPPFPFLFLLFSSQYSSNDNFSSYKPRKSTDENVHLSKHICIHAIWLVQCHWFLVIVYTLRTHRTSPTRLLNQTSSMINVFLSWRIIHFGIPLFNWILYSKHSP